MESVGINGVLAGSFHLLPLPFAGGCCSIERSRVRRPYPSMMNVSIFPVDKL